MERCCDDSWNLGDGGATRCDADDGERGGTVLLSEDLVYLDEAGRRLRVRHIICKAQTEAGAKVLETDEFVFSGKLNVPHLILARTISADGRRQDVGPDEAFVQRARGNSGSNIYDDDEEVVVIFPNIEPGAMTELILAFEDREARFDGEFSKTSTWSASWPILQLRRVVNLPKAKLADLQELSVGTVLAKRRVLDSPDDRAVIEWTQKNLVGRDREPSMQPSVQSGPLTALTTWKSWDHLVGWYKGELEGRETLGPELEKLVDEWTQGVEESRRILDLLYGKVANEVRYTGLEFGHAGLQPYDCNLVWERRFGDCKDKSNLLAAMLRHRGVEAWVALVNTEHQGVIHRDYPTPFQFDHAIVAVKMGDGGDGDFLFCDPTISSGRPGVLSPSSSGREVLVVADEKAVWRNTPEQSAGNLSYAFDLELDETGRISGWMDFHAEGYYASGYAEEYGSSTASAARRRLSGVVSSFFKGAEVVDVKLSETDEATVDDFKLRAFFTTPPDEADSEKRHAIPFPTAGFLFQDFGDGWDRETSYFQWKDEITVEMTIRLPEGMSIGGQPKPIRLETDAFLIDARWNRGEDATSCESKLRVACLKSVLGPDEVAGAAQANRSYERWAEVPVFVSCEGGGGGTKTEHDSRAGTMPLMSSGEGQLELVDRWFPLGSNREERRAALENVIRFFPDDPDSVYDARLRMAYLEYDHGDFSAALASYESLGSSRLSGVDPASIAFGEYMRGWSLYKLDQKEEALAVLVRLFDDESVSDYRRGWSGATLSKWSLEESPEEALRFAEKAMEFDGEFRESSLAGRVAALIALDRSAEVGALLFAQLSKDENDARGQLNSITSRAGEAPDKVGMGLHEALASAMVGMPESDVRRPWLQELYLSAKVLGESKVALPGLRKRLVEVLDGYGGDYFTKAPVRDDLETREQFEAHLEEVYNVKHYDWLAHLAEYFRRFEAGDRFTEFLWKLLTYADRLENPDTEGELIFAKLAEVADGIPHGDGNYWESEFVEASWLEEAGRWKEAEAIYAEMAKDPELDSDFDHSCWHRRGIALEQLGDWKGAIDCYLKYRDDRREFKSVVEHLLRAGVLLVLSDEFDRALETWALLRDVPDTTYDDSELLGLIEEALEMVEKPEKARDLWGKTRKWWDDSFALHLEERGGELIAMPPLVLFTHELNGLDVILKSDMEKKDEEGMMSHIQGALMAARVFPSKAKLVHYLTYRNLRPLDSSDGEDWRRWLMDYCTAIDGDIGDRESLRLARRVRIAVLLDENRLEDAIELWEEEAPRLDAEEDREHYERTIGIFCQMALRAGRLHERALELVVPICDGEMRFLERGTVVPRVVSLMKEVDRSDDAVAFLVSQLKRPEVGADDSLKAKLTEDLATLRLELAGGEDFRMALGDWLQSNKPSWYDHVQPMEFGEEELEELRGILEGKPSERHVAELFKLRILGALSKDLEPSLAESAFAKAVADFCLWKQTFDQYISVVIQVLDDERFSESLRMNVVWHHASVVAVVGDRRSFERFSSHSIWGALPERLKKQGLEELTRTVEAIASGDAETMVAAIEEIGKSEEIDSVAFMVIESMHNSLAQNGEVEAMKKVRKLIGSWKFDPSVDVNGLSLRLRWSREARRIKEPLELFRAMKAEFGKTIEALAEKAGDGWRERLNFAELDDLSTEDRNAYHAARILNNRYGAMVDERAWLRHPEIWFEDENGDVVPERLRKGLEIILESTSDDFIRLMILGELSGLQIDQVVRAELLDLVKPWRDAGKHPLAYTAIRQFEADHFKPGDEVDPAGFDVAARKAGMLNAFPAVLRMRALLANGDIEALEDYVDSLDAEVLLSSFRLHDMLFILEALEREDELEFVREKTEEEIHDFVLDSWLRPDMYAATSACVLATRLGRPDLLPLPWREHVAGCFVGEERRAEIGSLLALATDDWPLLEKETRVIVGEDENDHAANGLLGLALFRQEKNGEALPFLKKAAGESPLRRIWMMGYEELLEEVEAASDSGD